jgi:hypothetical protein
MKVICCEQAQARAQFDWLQERLRDPNFCGIAISGSGDFIPLETLRAIKSGEELMRILQPQSFPIQPLEKNLGKSEDNM